MRISQLDLGKLIAAIVVPLGIGFVGSLATAPAINGWYADLIKPALNPPNWVFGPAWTMLYIVMGVALFLVWRHGVKHAEVRSACLAFAVQLILNGAWSFLFFGLQLPGWAFVDIVLLLSAIITTTFLFYKVSRIAAFSLVPYVAWVTFATYLNAAIIVLN